MHMLLILLDGATIGFVLGIAKLSEIFLDLVVNALLKRILSINNASST
jgi:hypothetical protein